LKYSRYGTRRRRSGTKAAKKAGWAAWAGALIRSLAFLVLVVIGVAGVRLISGGLHTYTDRYSDPWKRPVRTTASSELTLAGPHPGQIQARNRRVVYPYSVVPGGVESTAELREAAAHDATVAQHYKGFDYDRARVVEVRQPRLVYLSYRRGGKVYWTSKQASLHPGEKLLSDGKITARTRCGNQVSVLPQANTSPEEPLLAELERPDADASGMEAFPGSFDSSLLNADPGMPVGPSSPAGGGTFAGGGGPPGGFIPLPIGGPIGGSTNPTGGGGCAGDNCNPPPAVPEPGTMVLVFSGAAAVFARFRYRRP
jgi:hypothetical protein